MAFIQRCHAEGSKVLLYLGLWDEASGIKDPDPLYAMATSPWYNSSQEALNELISVLEQSGDKVAVIVKQHPSGGFPDPLFSNTQIIPVLHLSPGRKPFNLMHQCDVIVTIASTLSYIAVANQKPLVLMGRNLLSNKHIAYEVTTPDELSQALLGALHKNDWEERMANRKQFIWAFARHW